MLIVESFLTCVFALISDLACWENLTCNGYRKLCNFLLVSLLLLISLIYTRNHMDYIMKGLVYFMVLNIAEHQHIL